MEQREIKFRALFENPDTRKKSWAYITAGYSFAYLGHTQVSPWLQYTGIKDKDGKDIYEGDIVRWSDGYEINDSVEVIVFKDGAFVSKGFSCTMLKPYTSTGATTVKLKVIGNIYENPELKGE